MFLLRLSANLPLGTLAMSAMSPVEGTIHHHRIEMVRIVHLSLSLSLSYFLLSLSYLPIVLSYLSLIYIFHHARSK